jgi:SAM-dependent methyltransferase
MILRRACLTIGLVFVSACSASPSHRDHSASPAEPPPAHRPPTPPEGAPASDTSDGDAIHRPTSAPYEGDLSIFEHPQRPERLRIERVMDLLGIQRGAVVADVGAGSGWFTVRAARRVGPGGSVFAVEINPKYVDAIATRARREGLDNVRAILGHEDDPLLPKASIDAVLLLKTYHELGKPLPVLRAIRRALRPSGRLGVIDREGRGDDHGIDEAVVIREAIRVGFALAERHDWSSPEERVDYFLIFRLSP